MASSFSIREINRHYYGTELLAQERMIDMMWIGIALVLIGVFLIGKSSN